ncbi:MAG: sulfotransferase domain-containing protein [Reyranellaceae bacterium]
MRSARFSPLEWGSLKAVILARKLLVRVPRSLLPERQRRLQRWLRGSEEAIRIGRSRAVVVSCAKSGRTWLHVMLGAYEQATGRDLRIYFTHDNYIRDVAGAEGRPWHQGVKVIVLARHPADISLSMFHHLRHRMTPRKRWLNYYPEPKPDMSPFDFVLREPKGMAHAVGLLNRWAAETRGRQDALTVRYEDLRADARKELARLVAFVDGKVDQQAIDQAVEYGSFENMQRRERESADRPDAPRKLKPGDAGNLQSFKTRSGEAGGYRRQFDADQVSQIDAVVRETLDPHYGYASAAETAARAAGR